MSVSPKLSGRFTLFFAFAFWFLLVSLLLRIVFFIWQADEVSWHTIDLLRTLLTGFFFDLGSVAFLLFPSALYYAIVPQKFSGSIVDKALVWFFTALGLFIIIFSFFAEVTFWEEFRNRFNFIAVDYLIYTHEVIGNIEQSYPLPLLIGGISLLAILVLFVFWKLRVFSNTFSIPATFRQRMLLLVATAATCLFYIAFITNNQAEWSQNRYNSEISKSGIYSFFAAFRNNQMKYHEFYSTADDDAAFKLVRNKLTQKNSVFTNDGHSIHRTITDSLPSKQNKNVVFILVESLSGSFMREFGNKGNITPFLDSLAQKSIFFNNLYATGTRTVRGMEAMTLCIPPTPGQSIVKRPENHNLFTISNVFRKRNYTCNFFYGGDGYFDNMNSYFGGNGFNIYDRGRGSVLSDDIKMQRHNIEDNEVTFENAWGICDEDIFNKMLKVADMHYRKGEPFLNFVMTTSNHKPFTYPENKVIIPSGMSREGAVQYTDFALRELFTKAKQKPWFKNTVFVIIADHCASSAGKDEIDVANYHIPAFIVNFPESQNQKVSKQCSQIDVFPTLFSLFHWSYESDFFGRDVFDPAFEERSFSGTYRKLVLMKGRKTMILSDQKKQNFYDWDKASNNLVPIPMDQDFLQEAISWYQTADYLFTNKGLK
jgi:phosphoglycerol transferase MdoB-like AlkP superfamily enzyme